MRRRAFLLPDALMGLVLVATVGVVLAVALSSYQRASSRLADSQTATSRAEQALAALQTGQAAPKADDATTIDIRRLAASDVPGQSWVEVRVSYRGRSASLAGMVPSAAVPATGPAAP